ncbi:MAG: hypothetical protein ACFHU9_00270 [Fluviicola sp.]
MTTKISKEFGFTPTSLILVLGMLLFGSGAFAQLDSVSVTLSFTQESSLDSTQTNDTIDVMNVEVYLDDIDFFSEVIVSVYDLSSGHPIAQIKSTKAELIALNSLSGSVATIEFPEFAPITGSYRVDVLARNFQGGNLPIVSETY